MTESPESPENSGESVPSYSQAEEYKTLLESRARARMDFADKLHPSDESEEFKQEMTAPEFHLDKGTGINYAVYRLNQGKEGTPVVFNESWSVAAAGAGRSDLRAYAEHLGRPMIVIDMEATGETSVPKRGARKDLTFDDIAKGHMGVIDELGVEEFDIIGHSLGGVVGAKMAALAGDRVSSLVTVSTPGFEKMTLPALGKAFFVTEGKNISTLKEGAPPEIVADNTAPALPPLRGIPTQMRLGVMLSQPVLEAIPSELSESTKWTDIVGSQDPVTSYEEHLPIARERNAENPGSSSVLLLGSEPHTLWYYKDSLAEAVSLTLEQHQNAKRGNRDVQGLKSGVIEARVLRQPNYPERGDGDLDI